MQVERRSKKTYTRTVESVGKWQLVARTTLNDSMTINVLKIIFEN
jgi:hypothetical protein